MSSEIAERADFSRIRYAQCWEDADILLQGLDIRPGDICLSIASAGDNTLAMLARAPAKVVAVDLSPAQLACLELRVAAYRALDHHELVELVGSRPSRRRQGLYRRCRGQLSPEARRFWDGRPAEIAAGIGGAGKFERYLALFRKRVLPLIHSRHEVDRLLAGGAKSEREIFHDRHWDCLAWRLVLRAFCSRFVLGHLGRDPRFFHYADGDVAAQVMARLRHAVTDLDPSENPYLHWILTGRHGTALPYSLRPENFDGIRENLDRLEWRCGSLEDYLVTAGEATIDRFNLSDVFEYMSPEQYHGLLERLVHCGRRGGRLAYWNFLAERRRPASLADHLRPLERLAKKLHDQDKAFFYSAFVVEEIA